MSLSSKLSIDKVDVKDKRVFVRVDYNVPLNKATGAVEDDSRIVASIPTIKYLLSHGARSIVLGSHLGRPDGRPSKKASLKPIAAHVSKLIGRPVTFLPECVGSRVEEVCGNPSGTGSVFLLENLRFHAEEEGSGVDAEGKKFKPTKEAIAAFRASLSSLCDIYVNDAFGAVHRAHSSITGVKPSSGLKAAGFLIQTELKAFARALESPARPFVAILGGAKVSDKIQLIENLLDKVDAIIIGGGMAYTFLKIAHGMEIGQSLFDAAGAKVVPKLIEKAAAKGVKLLLPIDHIISNKVSSNGADIKTVSAPNAKSDEKDSKSGGTAAAIPAGYFGVDIGPQTAARNAQTLWRAKTVIFNGPLGVFEIPAFAAGTLAALQACAAATQLNGALTIIGGGDTASAANQFGFASLVSHVSTGGGASLELLEGKALPGIVSLSDVKPKSKL